MTYLSRWKRYLLQDFFLFFSLSLSLYLYHTFFHPSYKQCCWSNKSIITISFFLCLSSLSIRSFVRPFQAHIFFFGWYCRPALFSLLTYSSRAHWLWLLCMCFMSSSIYLCVCVCFFFVFYFLFLHVLSC